MARNLWLAMFAVALLAAGACLHSAMANESDAVAPSVVPNTAVNGDAVASERSANSDRAAPPVDLFDAVDDGQAEMTFIAKNDHAGRVILTNKTKRPLRLKLPEAFAGVPVLAQFGGGGGARGGGGGFSSGTGGGQQTTGGGFGGGGGGFGGGGGGGGFFSIPPEQTRKVDVPLLCLDHGLRDPSSSKPYKLVAAESHLDNPAVIELLKAFGRGELRHDAAQAAAWHLSSNMSWNQLAAKLSGTRRSFARRPYFSAAAIRAGIAYANEARRRAVVNADLYRKDNKLEREPSDEKYTESSDSRSTTEMEDAPADSDAPAQAEAENR
jgi:hypothetical protein